jgi:hypothetical protein
LLYGATGTLSLSTKSSCHSSMSNDISPIIQKGPAPANASCVTDLAVSLST